MNAPAGVREAYDASASAWAAGPAPVYDVLAEALVARSPVPVAGAVVLDLGAGTGPAGRSARRAGAARVIGVDLSSEMLRRGSGWDVAIVSDAVRLPFGDGVLGLVVAACCLGHLPRPDLALVETRRVADSIVASAFLSGWSHPAKARVDAVAARHGFVVPPWYVKLKSDVEPAVDEPVNLAALARTAGYRCIEVTTTSVDVGVRTPAEMTRWRLGMAHLAPFAAKLGTAQADELRLECEAALGACPPLVVPLVVLAATSV